MNDDFFRKYFGGFFLLYSPHILIHSFIHSFFFFVELNHMFASIIENTASNVRSHRRRELLSTPRALWALMGNKQGAYRIYFVRKRKKNEP